MAWSSTPVQQKATRASSSSVSITLTSTPTAGNLLVACVASVGGNNPVINVVSGWTQLVQRLGPATSSSMGAGVFIKTAGVSEPTGVTWTGSGTTSGLDLNVSEWSGGVPTADVTTSSDSGSSTTQSQATGTTTTTGGSNDLAIAVVGANTAGAGGAVDSGFTLLTLASSPRMFPAYKILSGRATTGATFTWTSAAGRASGVVATISPAAFTLAQGNFLSFM